MFDCWRRGADRCVADALALASRSGWSQVRAAGQSKRGIRAINAYLLSLASLFAFGGRLADTVGPRKMVIVGVIVFASASVLCGLTPKGSLATEWIIAARVAQGAGGAIMFPAALAIVVQTFSLHERGKALATFFGVAGGLTAIGPILGGYLTQWTWRAIFWVNVPVAMIALARDGRDHGRGCARRSRRVAAGVAGRD